MLTERAFYCLPKNEDSRQPQCPEDKESAILFAFFIDSAEKTSYPDFFSENVIPRFKFSSSSTTSIPGIAYAPLFVNYSS